MTYTPYIQDKIRANDRLTEWAREYQPDLLRMTSRRWHMILNNIYGFDLYKVIEILKYHGFEPNGEMILALLESTEKPG